MNDDDDDAFDNLLDEMDFAVANYRKVWKKNKGNPAGANKIKKAYLEIVRVSIALTKHFQRTSK